MRNNFLIIFLGTISMIFADENTTELNNNSKNKDEYHEDICDYQKNKLSISDDMQQIIVEASIKKINPIELAFKKLNLKVAEELFKTGLFDHPGYNFSREWKKGNLTIWMKPVTVVYLNEWGGERYFTANKIDLEALKLLMKYDVGPDFSLPMRNTNNYNGAKEWHFIYAEIMSHAYKMCDLEVIATLYPLYKELQGYPRQRFGTDFGGKPAYLIDPFLSDFPIDLKNPKHFFTGLLGKFAPNSKGVWMGPSIWDFRPDDNFIVRELKEQIQQMVWEGIRSDEIVIN